MVHQNTVCNRHIEGLLQSVHRYIDRHITQIKQLVGDTGDFIAYHEAERESVRSLIVTDAPVRVLQRDDMIPTLLEKADRFELVWNVFPRNAPHASQRRLFDLRREGTRYNRTGTASRTAPSDVGRLAYIIQALIFSHTTVMGQRTTRRAPIRGPGCLQTSWLNFLISGPPMALCWYLSAVEPHMGQLFRRRAPQEVGFAAQDGRQAP